MIQIEDFYDDQGTYIFRKPEYPKKIMKVVYESTDEARNILINVLKDVILARQQEDIAYIQEGYKKSIAWTAARLPEAKREEALGALHDDVAEDVRNIIKNKTLETVIPEEEIFGAIPTDIHELKKIIHKVSGNLTSKEIQSIIDEYVSDDSDFCRELKKEIFLFDDIVYLDDRSVQKILREIDATVLRNALIKSDEEVINKFLRNMSDRAGKMLVEDMHILYKTSKSNILYCQHKILEVIRRLENMGEIIIEKFDTSDLV